MNIEFHDAQAIATPKKPHGTFKYGSFSIISHLLLAGVLFSGALFADNVVTDEGDDSIKAIMVDLSQIASPEQSLVENTQEVKGVENSEIVDNKIIEEIPPEPVVEPEPEEIVKEEEKVEPIVEPIIEKPIEKPVETPVKEVVVKQPEKPKPKRPPVQKASQQQVRQEVASNNVAPTAVAPSISDNMRYSASPSPISRNQPEYPRRALDMRLEGHVVVLYDVNSEGRIENIRIVESTPSNIFNRSVINAMKTWKYKPVPAKDLTIKIIFNRNKSISLSNV